MILGRSAFAILALGGVIVAQLYQNDYPEEPTVTTVYEGTPTIRDGDNVRIDDTSIRLVGIDACELGQPATFANREIDCGVWARDHFRTLVGPREVRCESSKRGYYGRPLATCFIGKRNINRALVDHGYVFLDRSSTYADARDEAQAASLGIWKFEEVEHPADYRERQQE